MKLIIGGCFQGKLEYVMRLTGVTEEMVINGSECSLDGIGTGVVLNRFHELIRRLLEHGCNIKEYIDKLVKDYPDIIIICDEVGYGLIPLERKDREYREAVGRICSRLAADSEEVHRVVCGIGTIIKG